MIEEDCTKRNLLADGAITVDRTIIFNIAVNYRLKRQVWPMVEQDWVFWSGHNLGRKQTFLTPGLTLGSFPLDGRLRVAIGRGFQTAVTPITHTTITGYFLCASRLTRNGFETRDRGAVNAPFGVPIFDS